LAGNEKKKTVSKTTDHKKKMTHQNEMLPGQIKLKKQKNDGEETNSNNDELFEKKQSHVAPGMTKEKGMHHSEDEVQVIEGTSEKKAVDGGKTDIEKPMEFNFVKELY
jgi:hypothetical protein